MKIVIALDSFKGSCSAQAACAAVAQGLRRVDQTLELVEMPVSDGGEGLLSTLADSPLLKGRCGNSSAVPRLMGSPAGGFPDPARRAGHYRDGAKLWARTHAASAAGCASGQQLRAGRTGKGGAGRRVSAFDYRHGRQRDQRWRHRFCPGARRTILA